MFQIKLVTISIVLFIGLVYSQDIITNQFVSITKTPQILPDGAKTEMPPLYMRVENPDSLPDSIRSRMMMSRQGQDYQDYDYQDNEDEQQTTIRVGGLILKCSWIKI